MVFSLLGIWYGYAGNLYVPLELGKLDMAFSRLNSISAWFFIMALLMLAMGARSRGKHKNAFGWTMYPPLSSLLSAAIAYGSWLLITWCP